MRVLNIAVFVLLAGAAVAQQADLHVAHIRVRTLVLRGDNVLAPRARQSLVRELTRRTYRDLDEIGRRVLGEYQDRGYFKTVVEVPTAKVVRHSSGQEIVDVVVDVRVSRLYRLKDILFRGAKELSPAQLRTRMPRPGTVFKRTEVVRGLEYIRRLYAKAGYLNYVCVPDTNTDDQAGLISLVLDIDEGQIFHWGNLIVRGTGTPAAREKLLQAWERHRGKRYDLDRTPRLLLRELGARPDIDPYELFSVTVDQQAATVHLEITLAYRDP